MCSDRLNDSQSGCNFAKFGLERNTNSCSRVQQRISKCQHRTINCRAESGKMETLWPNASRGPVVLVSVVGMLLCCVSLTDASFFTFYLPGFSKHKGFDELSGMITRIDNRIRETKDSFADASYFWKQMELLDSMQQDLIYPEESVCKEVFPMFRELAIKYAKQDYEHYITPLEMFKKHLEDCRKKWYPAGLESKAALPREWEQDLLRVELEVKIEWLQTFTERDEYKAARKKMIEIWKNVRRGLDTSLPCIYLKYAFHQVAEDINQISLEANLQGLQEALRSVESAYERIAKFKESDEKIIREIEEENNKVQQFTIRN